MQNDLDLMTGTAADLSAKFAQETVKMQGTITELQGVIREQEFAARAIITNFSATTTQQNVILQETVTQLQAEINQAVESATTQGLEVTAIVDALKEEVKTLRGNELLKQANDTYNEVLLLKRVNDQTVMTATEELEAIQQDVRDFNARLGTTIGELNETILFKIDASIDELNETILFKVETNLVKVDASIRELSETILHKVVASIDELNKTVMQIPSYCGEVTIPKVADDLCRPFRKEMDLVAICSKFDFHVVDLEAHLFWCSSVQLYAVGGQNSGSSYLSSVESFNGASWTTVGSMRTARRSLGVAVYEGYLYAVGGYSGSSYLSSVERYYGTSWTTVGSMGTARASFGVAVYEGYLYAVGGYSGSSELY